MKISDRSQKLSQVIQEQLPRLVDKFTSPNQVGFLTISAVEVAGDLSLADIFVNTIGGPSDYIKHLAKIAPKLQHEIAQIIKMRRTCRFRFLENKAPAYVRKIQDKF